MKMESSFFVSAHNKGVFRHFKVKGRVLLASTVQLDMDKFFTFQSKIEVGIWYSDTVEKPTFLPLEKYERQKFICWP